MAWQTADALAAAHAKGIIHRDLKPDNLMLVTDPVAPGKERVKLLDFGIAKLTAEVTAAQPMTAHNQLLGTPMYMSPEQCRSAASVDDKSDVYALGVVLYEMLAGRPPFLAEQMVQFLAQHLFEAPPPLGPLAPHVPAKVAELVHRMLAKEKDVRPAMIEASQLLEKLQGDSGSSTGKVTYKKSLIIGSLLTLLLVPTIGFIVTKSSIKHSPRVPGKVDSAQITLPPTNHGPPSPPEQPLTEPLQLTMMIKPELVHVGQDVQVRVTSSEQVYLLLLGIEQGGQSTLLAPWGARPTSVAPQAPLSFPPRGNRFAAMLPRGVNQTTESLWAIGIRDRAIYDDLCSFARKSVNDEAIHRRLTALPATAYVQERKTYQIVRDSK